MSKVSEAQRRLGAFLKAKRTEMGFSQSYVSQKMGYTTPQFVSNFERGLCSPPQHKIKELMALYKISPKTLLGLMLDVQEEIIMEMLYDGIPVQKSTVKIKKNAK